MFTDGRSLNEQDIETDICIIGAGPAGIAIAQQFINTDYSVTMIESGNFETDSKAQALNVGENTGIPTSIDDSRLRQFGGATNHWEGMCAPLQPIDFEERAWVKNSGWPFPLDDLLPYYARSSKFLNLMDTGQSNGKTRQATSLSDEMLSLNTWRFPENLLIGEANKPTLRQAKNINIILNATVIKIHTDASATLAKKLTVATLENQKFSVTSKRYILAAGGLENPRIMLLSNDIIPAGIGNANDLVGRYFMQHPHVDIGHLYVLGDNHDLRTLIQSKNIAKIPKRNKPTAMYSVSLTHKLMEEKSVLNNAATIYSFKKLKGRNKEMITLARGIFNDYESNCYDAVIRARCEQLPNPESRVELSANRKDLLGLPTIKLNWQLTEIDWLSIRNWSTLFAGIISSKMHGVMQLNEWLGQNNYWPKAMHGGAHHMGTTRMHRDPRFGVVDANCKLHGMENVYIAGSSVFPTTGWANPTHTLVALALRLADHLKEVRP